MPIKLAVMLPSSKARREIPGKLLAEARKGDLPASAVERDLRHTSQPNLLYPFAPSLVLQGGSAVTS
jgi:hypothetical protein